MSDPMTSNTIVHRPPTDVQIRELREALLRESANQMTDDTDACGNALSDGHFMREIARARCAEILNVRNGAAKMS